MFNISVEEDGEYTCVPENKVGIGSNASVGITAVGEFHFRFNLIICSQYKDSTPSPPLGHLNIAWMGLGKFEPLEYTCS